MFFYDSISPIVDADTVDKTIAFPASRYDKSLDGTGDYLNCPFSKAEYERFVDELIAAQTVEAHIPDDVPYFEACLPIEEIARRGRDTLRFGPMKPMGLTDPRTGRRPWAAVQLRQENLRADSYNLVGFQNHLRFAEQKRILRLIPGLENAEFLRYGQIHRNTYINAPALLDATLRFARIRTSFLPADFGRGRICGIDRDRACGGHGRGGAGSRRSAADVSARNGDRFALPLCFARGRAPLPAGQHRVRSVSAARSESARPQGAANGGLQTGAREARRIRRRFMSELAQAIEDFLGEQARRNDSAHTLRNYRADLVEFLEYFSPPGTEPPAACGASIS